MDVDISPGTSSLDHIYGLEGYRAHVAGSLLAKMCGDVLGASVEGWSPERLLETHPDGLTEFQQTVRG